MVWPFKKTSLLKKEDAAVKKAISRVIDTKTHYGFTGHPNVRALEEAISKKIGGLSVIGMNSGTDALIAALKLFGIGPGDEVIVPVFSFISTASCIGWAGAKSVFIDIKSHDFAIDPKKIEEKITSKTKAILVAHLFGQPASGMEKILFIAKKYNIPVIEDAAQSFGAKIFLAGEWKMVGTLSDIGCLSFSSTKPFAAPGNGGAIIIKNEILREEAARMRSYGAKTHYYDYPTIGINSKLHDIQAAALLAKLPFFEQWLVHRKDIADYYTKSLYGVGDLILPQDITGTIRTYYRYVIRTKNRAGLYDYLVKFARGVPRLYPTINYPVPLAYFSAFKESGSKPGDFPIAEQMSQEVISLPVTNYNTLQDAAYICEAIKKFFKKQ